MSKIDRIHVFSFFCTVPYGNLHLRGGSNISEEIFHTIVCVPTLMSYIESHHSFIYLSFILVFIISHLIVG